MARELDDAILHLRTNELELGLWLIKTTGNAESVLAIDEFLLANQSHWFVREVLGMMRRTFARLDVSSRSIFAIVEPGSCFAGTLAELALGADRMFMRDAEESGLAREHHAVEDEFRRPADGESAFAAGGALQRRFRSVEILHRQIGKKFSPREALEAGLVTVAPDDLDWEDELRQAIESRAALSPDGLTGLEANLRFGGSRNDGNADLRTAVGLAELDFYSAECGGNEWRAESLRHWIAREIQLGTSLSGRRCV